MGALVFFSADRRWLLARVRLLRGEVEALRFFFVFLWAFFFEVFFLRFFFLESDFFAGLLRAVFFLTFLVFFLALEADVLRFLERPADVLEREVRFFAPPDLVEDRDFLVFFAPALRAEDFLVRAAINFQKPPGRPASRLTFPAGVRNVVVGHVTRQDALTWSLRKASRSLRVRGSVQSSPERFRYFPTFRPWL